MENGQFSERYEASDETVQAAVDQDMSNPIQEALPRQHRKTQKRELPVQSRTFNVEVMRTAIALVTDADGNVDYSRLRFNDDGSIDVVN